MPPAGEAAPPFETYEVSFEERAETTLGDVFGKQPLKFSEMTNRLWNFIRDNKLTVVEHEGPRDT